jgi:hypothetical protein
MQTGNRRPLLGRRVFRKEQLTVVDTGGPKVWQECVSLRPSVANFDQDVQFAGKKYSRTVAGPEVNSD